MRPPPKLKVDVVTTVTQANKAMKMLMCKQFGHQVVFGLDCEWDAVTRRGRVEVPALLQIGRSNGYCALFRLNIFGYIPEVLADVLADPEFIKVGVGVVEDSDKLWDSFGVDTKRVLDVRFVAEKHGIEPKGLSYLCEKVLGVKRKKISYQSHKWTVKELTERKKHYAALDAVSPVRIFDILNQARVFKAWGKQWKRWSAQTYQEATKELWEKYFDKEFYYDDSKTTRR